MQPTTHIAELLTIADLLSHECSAATQHRSSKSRNTRFHKALLRVRQPLQTVVARQRFNAIGRVGANEWKEEIAHTLIQFNRALVRCVDTFYPPPTPCPKAVSDLLMSAKTGRGKLEEFVNRMVWIKAHAKWWDLAKPPKVVHKSQD
jgi:hypothetical protein